MNYNNHRSALLFALGIAAGVARAEGPESNWEVQFSGNALFNVSSRFQGHPAALSLSNAHIQPGANNYDNGYVGPDISGSSAYSSYWGYTQSSQPVVSGGNVTGINFERTKALNDQSSPRSDADPGPGGEITLRRKLCDWDKVRLGIELGAGYNRVDIDDSSSYSTSGQRTDYGYTFPAAIPTGLFPPPGYQGTFAGPGVNIDPTGTTGRSSAVANSVLVSGSRDVGADLIGFRLGPYLDFALTERLSVSVSAGGLLEVVHDQVNWSENLAVNTASAGGYWTGSSSVSGENWGVVGGFYAGGELRYDLTKCWNVFAGARFQDAGTYAHHIGAGEMDLNLSQAFCVSAGLGYSF